MALSRKIKYLTVLSLIVVMATTAVYLYVVTSSESGKQEEKQEMVVVEIQDDSDKILTPAVALKIIKMFVNEQKQTRVLAIEFNKVDKFKDKVARNHYRLTLEMEFSYLLSLISKMEEKYFFVDGLSFSRQDEDGKMRVIPRVVVEFYFLTHEVTEIKKLEDDAKNAKNKKRR